MYNKVPTIQCELADLTGNSLTDSLCSYRRDDGGNNHSIWMNNGEAWEHGAFADTPFTMFDMYAGVPMQQCVLADLNGDGLTDSLCSYSRPDQGVVNQVRLHAPSRFDVVFSLSCPLEVVAYLILVLQVYVNDGRAWVSGAFEPPSFVMFQIEGKKTPDQQCDLADVNGDGLTDVVWYVLGKNWRNRQFLLAGLHADILVDGTLFLYIYLSTYLPIYLSTYLPIYLSHDALGAALTGGARMLIPRPPISMCRAKIDSRWGSLPTRPSSSTRRCVGMTSEHR